MEVGRRVRRHRLSARGQGVHDAYSRENRLHVKSTDKCNIRPLTCHESTEGVALLFLSHLH